MDHFHQIEGKKKTEYKTYKHPLYHDPTNIKREVDINDDTNKPTLKSIISHRYNAKKTEIKS